MKKLFIILIAAIAISACTVTQEESKPSNPERTTTLEMMQNIQSVNATYSVVNDQIYFIEEGKVVARAIYMDNSHTIVSVWFIIIGLITVAVCIIGMIIVVCDL